MKIFNKDYTFLSQAVRLLSGVATRNRQEYLDLFRGFGILLMVLCHIGCGNTLTHFISAFHMPMWFIISGYLLSRKTNFEQIEIGRYLKTKAKSLLVPYFSFGLLCYVVYCLIEPSFRNTDALKNLFWMNSECKEALGAFWFLTAMFFANLIYYYLSRFIANQSWRSILMVLIALLGNILPTCFSIRLPLSIDNAFVGVGLMHIGYLLGTHEDSGFAGALMNMNWKSGLCIFFTVIVLIFLNGTVRMRPGQYSVIPLFWINAAGATIVGMNVSKGILSRFSNKTIPAVILSYIESVGEHSVVYLCLNLLVILVLYKAISVLGLPVVAVRAIVFACTMAILGGFSLLVNRTRLKVLIGKF